MIDESPIFAHALSSAAWAAEGWYACVISMSVKSRVGAEGLEASLQPPVPSLKRFGEPEMIIGSVELAGVRRLRTEGLGLRLSAGAERSSAAMFD